MQRTLSPVILHHWGGEGGFKPPWTLIFVALGVLAVLGATGGVANMAWNYQFRGLTGVRRSWAKVQRLGGWTGLEPMEEETASEWSRRLADSIELPAETKALADAYEESRYGRPDLVRADPEETETAYLSLRGRVGREVLQTKTEKSGRGRGSGSRGATKPVTERLTVVVTSTAMGAAGVSLTAKGIRHATLFHHSTEAARAELAAFGATEPETSRRSDEVKGLLQGYANGEGASLDEYPVDLDSPTPFQRDIWMRLRDIPRGETRSYGWMAAAVGKPPSAARAVGGGRRCEPSSALVAVPPGRGGRRLLAWLRRWARHEAGSSGAGGRSRPIPQRGVRGTYQTLNRMCRTSPSATT